jgi:hypothetical protein
MAYIFYVFKILNINGPIKSQLVPEFFSLLWVTSEVDNDEDYNGDSKDDNEGLKKSLNDIALHK